MSFFIRENKTNDSVTTGTTSARLPTPPPSDRHSGEYASLSGVIGSLGQCRDTRDNGRRIRIVDVVTSDAAVVLNSCELNV